MRLRLLLGAGSIVGIPVLLLACAPRTLTRLAAAAFPGCRYEITIDDASHPPRIALTIDDAPDARTTPVILDTLGAYGAKATFFVITSQVRASDGVLDPVLVRLRRDGHEIGNHLTQDRVAIRLDSAAFEADLARADSILRPYSPSRWARPGSGWYSRRMVRTMRRAGYDCALGSVYPADAGLGWPWLSERYILMHARPGAIIILHDRGARGDRTAEVLGRVLPALRARGYQIVTLSELASRSRTRPPAT